MHTDIQDHQNYFTKEYGLFFISRDNVNLYYGKDRGTYNRVKLCGVKLGNLICLI